MPDNTTSRIDPVLVILILGLIGYGSTDNRSDDARKRSGDHLVNSIGKPLPLMPR
jgi:hypothetical protein